MHRNPRSGRQRQVIGTRAPVVLARNEARPGHQSTSSGAVSCRSDAHARLGRTCHNTSVQVWCARVERLGTGYNRALRRQVGSGLTRGLGCVYMGVYRGIKKWGARTCIGYIGEGRKGVIVYGDVRTTLGDAQSIHQLADHPDGF